MRLFYLIVVTLFVMVESSATILQTNSDLILVNRLKQYELQSHTKFQSHLNNASETFIEVQSEKFVDNETGFFKIWGQAIIFYFESETKTNSRWKTRVEKYFRSTKYIAHLDKIQNDYELLINNQRKEMLGQIHLASNSLQIENQKIQLSSQSSKKTTIIVDKVNKIILSEVIPEIIEAVVMPLLIGGIIFLLGLFAITIKKFFLTAIGFIVIIGISVWQNIKYSIELETNIIETYKLTDNDHLKILDDLNSNTELYYTDLIKSLKNEN